MKIIKTFEQYISEVKTHTISGNSGRTITTLDNRKYELNKDIKDARIGDYTNVVLPKGTIIINLPGGVFANHKDLKDKYCTGYKSQRWDDKFGVAIRTMPDTLESIEDNSKILESIDLEETLNELSLTSVGVRDFLRAVYNNTNVLKKLGFKNFRNLTDYVKNSDLTEWDDLRDEARDAGLILAESKGIELVHAYDKDGSMYGTGELIKKQGNKSLIRFDRENEKWFDNKSVKLVESKSQFPDQVEGNDGIIFKKEWEKMNGGKLAAKYNQYYRGYDIDLGGHIFGSVDELEKYMKNYILSNNLYNKYKYAPEKTIDESILNEAD